MPVFSTNIGTQNQAGSAGIRGWPDISNSLQYLKLIDRFTRTDLNPSGAPSFYSTGGVGTPVITANGSLGLTTSIAINDNAYAFLNECSFLRTSPFVDTSSQVVYDIIIATGALVTSNQQFFGIMFNKTSGLTALPTTARHMGVYLDTSVSPNWKLSSADGTTQTTTDSGTAAALKSFYRLNITWTGDDSATITLYNTTPTTFPFVWTQIGQQTVKSFQTTQIGYLSVPLEIHMFIQTLTTAARSTFIWEYSIGFL